MTRIGIESNSKENRRGAVPVSNRYARATAAARAALTQAAPPYGKRLILYCLSSYTEQALLHFVQPISRRAPG